MTRIERLPAAITNKGVLVRTLAAPLVVALSVAVVLAGCSDTSGDDQEERSLTIGVPFLWPSDPYVASGLFLEPQALYEPLWNLDESDYSFTPRLAREFTLSDDRLTLELTLRDDVDFTDGVHFDAEALVEYLEILIGDETYPGNFLLTRYDMSFEITGEYELTITTTQPMNTDFFTHRSWFLIASPEAIKDHEAMAETSAGSGPYLRESVEPEISATYVRNENYWNPDAVDFDRVTFVVYSDPIALLNAVKTGQLDAATLDVSLAAEAESAGLAVHQGGGQFGTLVFLDHDGSIVPALGDVRVRQAMNLVFDRATIAEELDYGYGAVSSQAILDIQEGYVEGGDTRYGYDLEQARELMAEAGYEDGFDITIPTTSSAPEYSPAYEPIVQQALSEIGIRVTYEAFPDGAAHYDAVISGKYPVLLMKLFYNNTYNYMKDNPAFVSMVTPEVAELIDVIDNGSTSEREEAFNEFGELILDEAWFAPFSRPATLWVTIPEVDVTVGALTGYPILQSFVAVD
jgi:peptide/nickel transport system substrate-binding protein